MTKFFETSKKPILNFLRKRGCQFLNIPVIYHLAKQQKKTHSWEKGGRIKKSESPWVD